MLRRLACCSRTIPMATRTIATFKRFGPPASVLPRTSLLFEVDDQPGALQNILQFFWKFDVNMTRIESRPDPRFDRYQFFVTVEGSHDSKRIERLLESLRPQVLDLQIIGSPKVPWFPRRPSDIDELSRKTLDGGAELEADHPGFHDREYRERRDMIVNLSKNYKHGTPLPRVDYTELEINTWKTVWNRLVPQIEKHACSSYLHLFPLLMENCGYREDNIPQLADVSSFLQDCTGFTLRPVGGLLSARDFFYGLAFRIFFSTQYIRHHSKPLYTPEPDLVHELMGHAVMFADPDFADFSQDIGLAAIGASDEEIEKLARCYWYTVEFGQVQENSGRKAFGAGLLSSFGELEYSMSDEPEVLPWNPNDASTREFPITTYQPVYYVADDFKDLKAKMNGYIANIPRPFNVKYDVISQKIHLDRDVVMEDK